MIPKTSAAHFSVIALVVAAFASHAVDDGVFVRFKMNQPVDASYYIRLGGCIHDSPWYLSAAVFPSGADKKDGPRLAAGKFSDWFDLKTYAGKNLHKKKNRAGGIAELPNITAQFIIEPAATSLDVEVELATAADPAKIVKRWKEAFQGNATSFLVSPRLEEDAALLENASEMTARRMKWATDATGGVRHAPQKLILQTQFWGPQRPELNAQEAKILSLLGFNVVGNLTPAQRDAFPEFRLPYASHDVPLGPQVDPADIEAFWEKWAKQTKAVPQPLAPFNFQDEICARPVIGTDAKALKHFHEWLKGTSVPPSPTPAELGVANLDDVVPIETPDVFNERKKIGEPAARRIFYYTSRFRQYWGTQSLIWNTDAFHARFGPNATASTLLADHPYFGGTGLGMGFNETNNTWGGYPLALDWFDIGRRQALDIIGIEDWMGLQFMYGPGSTWEGFQLMGFQAAIFRSASRGKMPIIAWITPSDERNLRLKSASALCQGAKHFFYWCYGPTATSTENYWSDQPGSYPGMAHLSRLLEAGEPIIAPGTMRKTKVALLYSISSDLWQPFDYIHMLERRGLYFALIHDHYLVDMLTEEDVANGRLKDYRVLYSADPCISGSASKAITAWIENGGTLVATCASGSFNEFGERSGAFPIEKQSGNYRTRGKLNDIPELDRVKVGEEEIGVTGLKISRKAGIELVGANVIGVFKKDGSPAIAEKKVGNGRTVIFEFTPGIGYIKDAKFVAGELAEKWPEANRKILTRYSIDAGAAPLLKLSDAVVEACIYDAPTGTALILANFTYQTINALQADVPVREKITSVKSLEHGALAFELLPAPQPWKDEGYDWIVRFTMRLGIDDLVMLTK